MLGLSPKTYQQAYEETELAISRRHPPSETIINLISIPTLAEEFHVSNSAKFIRLGVPIKK